MVFSEFVIKQCATLWFWVAFTCISSVCPDHADMTNRNFRSKSCEILSGETWIIYLRHFDDRGLWLSWWEGFWMPLEEKRHRDLTMRRHLIIKDLYVFNRVIKILCNVDFQKSDSHLQTASVHFKSNRAILSLISDVHL